MSVRWTSLRCLYLPMVLIVGFMGSMGCASIGGGGTYHQAWGRHDKCRAVHFWVARFMTELPKPPDGTKSITGYYETYAINLFRDDYFVPVFGTRFDQMSGKDRLALGNEVEQCFVMSGSYKEWQDLNRYYGSVMPYWKKGGAEYAKSSRDSKQWQDRILSELKAAPASDQSFRSYLQAKAHAKIAMERFLPGETQRFDAALEQEGSRMAEAALHERVTKASAVPVTYEGLKELQRVMDESIGLFDMVAPAVRNREEARAAEAYREVLTAVIEEDWKRFETRGGGVDAVRNGVTWYRDFEARYFGVFELGPLGRTVLKRFREARENDFAVAGRKIEDLLSQATNEEWNVKQEEFVVAEVDIFVQAAKPVIDYINHREAQIAFQKQKWRFSKSEVALMRVPGVVSVPASYDPPAGEDIRMALLRAYVGAGGRLVDGHTATVSTASFDDLLGTFGAGGLPRVSVGTVTIGNVTVEECTEGNGSPLVGMYGRSRGYVCHYQTSGRDDTDEFILTSGGWRSPSADSRVRYRRDRMTEQFIKDFGSAVPKFGCTDRRGRLKWWCR